MAKRLAGSQLNHENWDHEEETEQAGIFKKASDTEIAGRVIKKAARRRANPMTSEGGEEKKNAFASFGGFSTKPADGGNQFGFLQKGGNDPTKASSGGFSFGSSSGADASKPSFGSIGGSDSASKSSFVFGSNPSAAVSQADAAKPAAATFSFGSSAASKPAFGSSTDGAKSGFAFGSPSATSQSSDSSKGFSFGSSTAASADPPKSTPFAFGGSTAKPLGAASPSASFSFGSKDAKKEESAVVKPTFGSPPASNGSSDTAPKGDLMAMFKPQAGSWSCDVCMIKNPADKTKCLACETPKPGAKPDTNGSAAAKSPVFGSGGPALGGFKFGASSDSGGGGGLKDGGGSTNEKSASGFSFGAGSTTSVGTSSSGFKFGSGSTTKEPEEKSSTTGAGFSFGSSATKTDSKSDNAFKIGGGTTDAKTSSPFAFGTSSMSSTKSAAAVLPVFGGDNKSGKSASNPLMSPPSDSSGSTSEKKSDMFASKPVGAGFAFGAKSDNSNSSDSSSSKLSGNAAFSFGAKSSSGTEKKEEASAVKSSSPVKGSSGDLEYSGDFLAHLQALNKQVTHWIQKHIDQNSFIILSPVFKDYEKHLKEITEKFPPKKKSLGGPFSSTDKVSCTTSSPASKFPTASSTSFPIPSSSPSATKFPLPTSSPANTVKPFSFGGNSSAVTAETKTEPIKPFAFGATSSENKTEGVKPFSFGGDAAKAAPAAAPAAGGFSFGLGAAKPAPGGGFTFGSGGMFSAGAPAPASDGGGGGGGGEKEDEYEPPKAEVTQVEETDALYSKKCKLFYKKDQNYKEKGVGMLHLKPADNGKTQLIVRADTNLGNILLNIILNKDIPTTRVGKNNVMLVCVPNPPINPKEASNEPVGMLIRVKTGEDADDLKSKLDEYKTK